MTLLMCCSVTSCVLAAEQVSAGKVFPIDLYTTLRLAGVQNLKVAEAEARAREASGEEISSYQRFLPTLSAELTFLKHTGLTQGTEGNFVDVTKQSSRFGGILTTSWDLNDAIFAVLISHQKKLAAKERVTVAVGHSMQLAAFSYLELVQAFQTKRIAQNSIHFSSLLVDQVDSAIAVGIASGIDQLRAQRLLNRDSLLWYRADEEEQMASARLASILNLDQSMQLVPLDTIVMTFALVDTGSSLESWLAEAAAKNPKNIELGNLMRSARWEEHQAIWGGLLPQLSGRISGAALGRTFSDLRDSKDYQFGVRWTLGPGGLFDVGRIRSRSARLRGASLQLEIAQDSVREMVLNSYESLRSRVRMLGIAKRGLDDAQRLLQLLTDRRTAGVSRSLEVILAAEDYEQTRLEHLRRVVEYNKAQIMAMNAVGRLAGSNEN